MTNKKPKLNSKWYYGWLASLIIGFYIFMMPAEGAPLILLPDGLFAMVASVQAIWLIQ